MYIYWQMVTLLKNVVLVFLELLVALKLPGLEIHLFGEETHKTDWRLGDGSHLSSSRGSKRTKFTHIPVSLFSLKMVRKGGVLNALAFLFCLLFFCKSRNQHFVQVEEVILCRKECFLLVLIFFPSQKK